ncbi:hypothetical protein [Clostridium autoethanogenum]|uniref:Bypass of forespore C C-terminal domain-containing protein n=1 Tax=Clostridium autoethanogenum DSM 10061 TaxID=1341692 RepID=A0ABM5NT39_9CLOT|nr:hypothetical protein [Clostridium autoethanogenum]AGY75507.1 hypothetical protein CAETHG_1282 [Clostridium autoethanogenum DSM 10061]ALU35673.1 Hypothetical protein CLAU_1244 [Clostridium autoethanogenum DSM 10061]OVY52265.1 hypothetical protein WX72_01161 [Clostridium autoethanogenum]
MDNRKVRTVVLVIFTILILGLSCYICVVGFQNVNMNREIKQVRQGNKTYDTVNTNSNISTTVPEKAKIIFKIKYNKSGELKTEKEELAGKLAGKSKNEVENIYKTAGYKVNKFGTKEVVLVKEVDKYEPNKYVLGIKNGLIAIYKTDNQGNMFIENEKRDVTDIKTSKLKEEDIRLLTKGDKYFECNTRDEAESRLEDYE